MINAFVIPLYSVSSRVPGRFRIVWPNMTPPVSVMERPMNRTARLAPMDRQVWEGFPLG